MRPPRERATLSDAWQVLPPRAVGPRVSPDGAIRTGGEGTSRMGGIQPPNVPTQTYASAWDIGGAAALFRRTGLGRIGSRSGQGAKNNCDVVDALVGDAEAMHVRVCNAAVGVDDEQRAAAGEAGAEPVGGEHAVVRVGEQRERQSAVLLEALVRADALAGDAPQRGVETGEQFEIALIA